MKTYTCLVYWYLLSYKVDVLLTCISSILCMLHHCQPTCCSVNNNVSNWLSKLMHVDNQTLDAILCESCSYSLCFSSSQNSLRSNLWVSNFQTFPNISGGERSIPQTPPGLHALEVKKCRM